MKDEEEETNRWFSRWEEGLPSAEELTPLSQTLITPDLALAFDITTNYSSPSTRPNNHLHHNHHHHPSKPSNSPSQSHNPPNSQTHQDPFDSSDVAAGAAGGVSVDDQARTLKRPRLVWTPQLHKRFVDAVAHLGIKNAVPKTIMQLMSVDGLTRENVASHLQKYRLYLKRMQQGMTSPPAGGCPPTSASIAAAGPLLHDPATEQLFATGPLPPHLLQHHHHHHHMAAALHHQHLYHHHHHQRSVSHVSSPPFDHLSYASPRQLSLQQRVIGGGQPTPLTTSFGQEYEQGRSAVGAERKVLTLFPTND